MARAVGIGLPIALLLTLLGGCHSPPASRYEPRLTMDRLVAGVEPPEDTFTLLVERETKSRFPCSLVIGKLTVSRADPTGPLVLLEMTPADEALWSEAFRGLAAVRDLLFLRPRNAVPSDEPDVDALLDAAQRLGAPLLLLHVVNRFAPNSAQVLGVLYDVPERHPLATIRTVGQYLDEDGEEEPPEKGRGDQRETDARYQAIRQFERQVVACLRAQIRMDRPPPKPEPHRWTPLYLYDWIGPVLVRPPASQPTPQP